MARVAAWVVAAAASLLLVRAAPGPGKGAGAATTAPEPSLKAAVILNVSRFVLWPETSLGPTNQPFRIGVLGSNPFGESLREHAARTTVHGHPVVIVASQRPSDLGACHAVFISPERELSLPDALGAFARRPVLTFGYEPDFARRGGMVNLRSRDGKSVLEINRTNVESRGLGIGAPLRGIQGIVWTNEEKAP